MTVGTELRQARERVGLPPEEISERTKIQLYKIEMLESGNFELLPQGIYLDGIVRAYAKEVGIAQEPLVERVRLERGTLPGDWPIPFAASIDLHPSPQPDVQALDDFDPDDPLSAFAAERELQSRTTPAPVPVVHAPARAERAMPALILVALSAAAGTGMYLYRTTPFLASANEAPIPYTESVLPAEANAAGSSPDVSGSWRLATQVESSSLARFEGLQLGYEMRLEQDGERVTGVGRKVTENGSGIGRGAQTPVTVSGAIDGDRLILNFVERGARRGTQGQFVLLMEESGRLRGSFSSSAARSSGRVEAHRLSTQ